MSRGPRKPGDPQTCPVPCGRCGGHYKIAARWPDASVCGYCYQQAKRTRGTCRCGHAGVLPGLVAGAPACPGCSGVKLNLDCRSCGAEDELYDGGRCWTCVLAATVDRLLTDPTTGRMLPELEPVAGALKSMKRANSGLTWIRQPHVTEFLTGLAATAAITHAMLDALPASRTREYVAACSSSMRRCPAVTSSPSAISTGPARPSPVCPAKTIARSSSATSAGITSDA